MMDVATSLKQKQPCISIALFPYHLMTPFHTLCVCPPFSCPPLVHPGGVYDTWTTQIAPPFPFHFYALSFPSRARGARSSSCRCRNPSRVSPSASLTVVPLHVHTHNPAELCMTSQKHSVRFLCLTALGIDNQIGTALGGYLFFVWCGIIGDLTNGQLCVNDRS
jgi:hypothetical protein